MVSCCCTCRCPQEKTTNAVVIDWICLWIQCRERGNDDDDGEGEGEGICSSLMTVLFFAAGFSIYCVYLVGFWKRSWSLAGLARLWLACCLPSPTPLFVLATNGVLVPSVSLIWHWMRYGWSSEKEDDIFFFPFSSSSIFGFLLSHFLGKICGYCFGFGLLQAQASQ